MHYTALLTDLHPIAQARTYVESGHSEGEAVFHLSFQSHPFGGGFTIAAGLESVVDFLDGYAFENAELEFLASLRGKNGQRLFENDFLQFLGDQSFACSVDAVPEGTVIFPGEPVLRIQGPLVQAQLLETALLNLVNHQSLVATKAARICLAAQGDPVIEYGLRRAPGPDGGLSASHAAFVGGCVGTSNVLAGMRYGIPLMGMHAHDVELAFDMEADEFDEDQIEKLKRQGAAIQAWGMGANLATGGAPSSMGGVYELSAVTGENGSWRPALEGFGPGFKNLGAGIFQVRRLRWGNTFAGDMLYDIRFPVPDESVLADPRDGTLRKRIPAGTPWEELLVPVFRRGDKVWEKPSLETSRERTRKQLNGFHPGIKLLRNPYRYPVGVERSLIVRNRRIPSAARAPLTRTPEWKTEKTQ